MKNSTRRENAIDKIIKLERRLGYASNRVGERIEGEINRLQATYDITMDDIKKRRQGLRERKNPENLYKSFHNVEPKGAIPVYYEPPKGKLIKIGRISEIRYIPENPSEKQGIEFYHKAGDLGGKTIKANGILCTNEEGNQLYIVREKKNIKYPKFTERGIIG